MTVDTDTIPTLQDIQDSKDAMDDIQSFTYSANDSFTDAKGVPRDTVSGRLKKMGYDVPVIPYAGSEIFTVDDGLKVIEESGVVYAPLPSALPFTTSGTFIGDDDARFFVVQGLTTNSTVFSTEFQTVNAMQISAIAFGVGKALSTGGIEWEVTENITSFPLSGGFYAQRKTIGSLFDFGLDMGGTTDVIPFIQSALDSMPHGGEYILPPSDFDYLFETELVIPQRCKFNMNNQRCRYSGTLYAITCGTSDLVLTYEASAINLRLLLTNKDGNGIRLRGTTNCDIEGYIEGVFSDFATRTNIGLDIDGVDVSAFNNRITLVCNHIHESVRLGTTGTVHVTANAFNDCFFMGDQVFGDNTSIGFNFQDSPVGAYDGTTIKGGNLEHTNTGIYFGNNAREISVDTRFEINAVATSRKLKYGTGTRGIRVRGAGLDIATMGAVPGGVEGFDGTQNDLEDRFGNVRTNGNADSFAGQLVPIRANGELITLRKEGAESKFIRNTDATDTSSELRQCGKGSASFGSYDRIHGAAHATRPGDYLCGPSSQIGDFRVTKGFGSTTDLFKVHGDASAISPGSDGTTKCGDINHKYSEFFGVNSTINQSDADLKTPVKEFTIAELKAGKEIALIMGSWQWLAKVETEGDDARIHYGPTVQAVMEVLADNNIEPFSISFVCYDEWEDKYKMIDINAGKLYTEEVHKMVETDIVLYDTDGTKSYRKELVETVVHRVGDPLEEDMQEVLDYPAGHMYSLRKTELLMLVAASAIHEQVKINARLDALESV